MKRASKKTKTRPKVVVLAGPNGAGKSTAAPRLLKGTLGVDEFVNADVIARGLSAFAPERASMAAGRIMMRRLRELAAARRNFAFETTLASRSFASWLNKLRTQRYLVVLVFLWLPSEEMAVQRVAERVRAGGHDVPESIVRRRYRAGIRNFFALFRPLADAWQVIDNSAIDSPRVVATGKVGQEVVVKDAAVWNRIQRDCAER
jgi:predicted ABC-type ATPase